jgi:alkylhydroperoxidase family enzyme
MSIEPIQVNLVQQSDDPGVIATFERVGASTGVGNIHRVVANATKVFPNYINYVYALRHDTKIEPVERELALVCVLDKLKAEYEFRAHKRLILTLGITEEQIDHLQTPDTPGIFTERQRALLHFAKMFATLPAERDALQSYDIRKHLDDQLLVELGLNLAMYVGMSFFTSTIHIPTETTMPFPKTK